MHLSLNCLGRPQLIRIAFNRYLCLRVLRKTKLSPGLQKVVLFGVLKQLTFRAAIVCWTVPREALYILLELTHPLDLGLWKSS